MENIDKTMPLDYNRSKIRDALISLPDYFRLHPPFYILLNWFVLVLFSCFSVIKSRIYLMPFLRNNNKNIALPKSSSLRKINELK